MKREIKGFIVEDGKGNEIQYQDYNNLLKLISKNINMIIRCDNIEYTRFKEFLDSKIMTWVFHNEYNYFGDFKYDAHIITIGKISKAVKDKHDDFFNKAKDRYNAKIEQEKLRFPSIDSFEKNQEFLISLYYFSSHVPIVRNDSFNICDCEYEDCVELRVKGIRETLKMYAIILSLKKGLEKNPYVYIEATLTFEGHYADIDPNAGTFFLLEDDYNMYLMNEQAYFYEHIIEEARSILNEVISLDLKKQVTIDIDDFEFINEVVSDSVIEDFFICYKEMISLYLKSSSNEDAITWESHQNLATSRTLISF